MMTEVKLYSNYYYSITEQCELIINGFGDQHMKPQFSKKGKSGDDSKAIFLFLLFSFSLTIFVQIYLPKP